MEEDHTERTNLFSALGKRRYVFHKSQTKCFSDQSIKVVAHCENSAP